MNAFKQFGSLKLERPTNRAKGFAYIIFDNENNVKALLEACTFDSNNGGSWYYKMSSGYSKIWIQLKFKLSLLISLYFNSALQGGGDYSVDL